MGQPGYDDNKHCVKNRKIFFLKKILELEGAACPASEKTRSESGGFNQNGGVEEEEERMEEASLHISSSLYHLSTWFYEVSRLGLRNTTSTSPSS